MELRVGVQGELGSACDEVAPRLLGDEFAPHVLEYLTTAERTLSALQEGVVDVAVVALESPLGVAVEETKGALEKYPNIEFLKVADLEVIHHLLCRPNSDVTAIRAIASHPVALRKHANFLSSRFPHIERIEVADTGLAAQLLAESQLPNGTAVIAMPSAARIFGLQTIETNLPGNHDYLTRFALLRIPR